MLAAGPQWKCQMRNRLKKARLGVRLRLALPDELPVWGRLMDEFGCHLDLLTLRCAGDVERSQRKTLALCQF